MLDYFLTEAQKTIVEVADRIGREYILPYAHQWDEEEVCDPRPLWAMSKADLFGLFIPEEFGGLGFGTLENCLAIETLSKYCTGVSTTFAASGLGAYPILIAGNKAQKQKYLPAVASGRKLCAFALTEPQAGSDASAIKTTALKEGDYYVLNGIKQWITNGALLTSTSSSP